MANPDSLGQFEQLVLTAILTPREDAYGVTIHSKVQELVRPRRILVVRSHARTRHPRAEAIVAVLVPPAYREEVLGNLHGRFKSPLQYSADVLLTVPLVIISRMRRAADPQILLLQAFALYMSFLDAASLNDGAFS